MTSSLEILRAATGSGQGKQCRLKFPSCGLDTWKIGRTVLNARKFKGRKAELG